ncbi:hypothetical protein DAEQUDRAFT_723728 [Daedalea quercina L-15889]|uniref:Uncharacterized protein n=1 Tax=Daedalea quercina L-15889 TaxID=1314783 RepID=A0A165S8N2_9APHY|nr:hypothetical protein DAEQUDRAFT_723728 [Daedalea quercina L-15889]
MKHATARTCIPWRVLDHLADLKADTEAFADLWDLHRRADLAIEPQVGAETFLGESCSGGLPGMLFNLPENPGSISEEIFDINGIAPSVDAFDELPGLRGLGDGI